MRTFIDDRFSFKLDLAALAGDESSATALTVETSSELTQGQGVGADVLALHRDLVAVQAKDGQPIVFSIDSDDNLQVVFGAGARSPCGRGQLRLAAGLGAVQALGVGQRASGAFVVAIAVAQANAGAAVYVTAALPDDPDQIPWETLQWHRRGVKQRCKGTRLLVGEEPVNPRRPESGPAVVLFTEENHEALHYRISSDLRRPEAPWDPLKLTQNVDKIVDVVVGMSDEGEAGVYALCEQSGAPKLWFVPQHPQAPHTPLPVPPGVSRERGALAVRTLSSGYTELFLCGAGVTALAPDRQRSEATLDDLQTIAAPAALSGVRSLTLREDAGAVALWALCTDGGLVEIIGEKSQAQLSARAVNWKAPMRLRSEIKAVAPLRNRRLSTDTLIFVSNDRKLHHWTVSPAGECWSKRTVAVNDHKKMVEFDCYASTVTFTLSDGRPWSEKKLSLKSSEWTELIVNGLTQEIKPGELVTFTTDSAGRITIFNKVAGLASPIFHLSGSGLESPVRVEPNKKIWAGLDGATDASKLREVTLEGGEKLIPDGVQSSNVEAVVGCMKRVGETRVQLPQDGSPSQTYLAGADLTDFREWGLSFDGTNLQFKQGADAVEAMEEALLQVDVSGYASQVTEGDLFSRAQPQRAGNIFQWFADAMGKAFTFVVRKLGEAFEFVIEIGLKAFSFIVRSLAQIGELAEAVWRQIKVGFEKLRKWLGFLFSWKDIVVTHEVMFNIVNQVMERGENEIRKLEHTIGDVFDDLIKKAKEIGEARIGHPAADKGTGSMKEQIPEKVAEKSEEMEDLSKSPQGSYANYHVSHSVEAGGTLQVFDAESLNLSADSRSFIDEVLNDIKELVDKVKGSVIRFGDGIYELVTGGQRSLNELLKRLGGAALVTVLEVAKEVICKIVRGGQRMVQAMRELLNSTEEIPFLSALYRYLTGKQKAPLLAMVLLLFAAPVTIAFKLFKGEAPFPFVDTMALEAAGDQDGLAALSTHERWRGASKKPRTYGLETLIGIPFWGALALTIGVIGGAGWLAWKVVEALLWFQDISTKAFVATVGVVIKVIAFVLQVSIVVGKAIWWAVSVPPKLKVIEDLRWMRLAGGALNAVAALLNCFEPLGYLASFVKIVALIPEVLAMPLCAVARIAYDAQQDDKWLVLVDVIEAGNAVVGYIGIICGIGSTWSPEGKSKTALFVASSLISAGTLVITTSLVATPFLTEQVYERIGL